MTRIFEDILDDIDIEEESNVVTDLANSSNDTVDVSQYDYVLELCFNVYDILDGFSMMKLERIEEDAYDEIIVPLKKKFDVYLDSYWTDDAIYVDERRLDSWNKADLLKANKTFLNVYYKVYLNFDGNLNHLISFIYSATNPNPQMSYALYDMYYSNLFKNDNIEQKITEIFDYIESYNLSQKYINNQTYLYTFHGMATKIYQFFYNQNRVLKFPKDLSPKECIDKIKDKLIAFTERKRDTYNK